jgi:L-arabonate dehydrase
MQYLSELTPCNAHFRDLAESVKRGIWEAGGFPVEFPVMSLGETLMKPTAMLYRNLASMDVEESIRVNPLDGVVLLCGCDKTTPSLYIDHVQQAHLGADMDFLLGGSGSDVLRDSH